ncbi:hypothetical protein NR798_33280 [Archangium gephyra]|uniref:LamG domain-containing protein n=1 Tax=Archangium gephyra TaxID=48 RepID=UPI0035D4AF74
MSISHILQQFDAIGPMGPRTPILIDQQFTGSNELISLFRAVLNEQAVMIDTVTDATSRSAGHLELVGSTSLLGMTAAEVRFLARERDGTLLVTLELTLPASWSFGKLFPALLGERPTGGEDLATGKKRPEPHFMTQLGLGACKLVFSNEAQFDEKLACDLVPGLNFVGELYLTGALFPIGSLLQHRTPTRITGPVNEFRFDADPLAFTGIRLSGPLALGFQSLGPVTVKDARIFIKSGHDDLHRDKAVSATQEPGVYLLVAAEVGGRPLEMVGRYNFEGIEEELFLQGRFEDFALAGFSSLSQTVGVDGFDDEVPQDLPVPNGISLTELGVSFDFLRHQVTSLMLGVGAKTSWDILPDVAKLQEIGVSFTVANPFGSGRSISTSLSGLLAFQKFDLAAFVELPSLDLGAGLPAGRPLPLGDVIESLIPGETGLPELTISRLLLRASPQARSFYLTAALQDLLSIPVGATAFEVSNLNLLVDYSKAGGAKGLVSAQLRMGEANVLLSGEARGGLTLSGSLRNFALKKFWSLVTNGESLPEEIPDILFDTLNVQVNTQTGAFSVLGNASVAWDHLGGAGPLQTNAQFSLTRNVSGSAGSRVSSFSASLSLQGRGPVNVAEGLSLETFNFLFDYQTGIGWKLSGGMGASVFDTRLDLQAGYETTQGIQKIKLRATAAPARKLIDIPGVGSYAFAQFDLLLDRRTAADGKKKTFFELRLASTLELDQLFSLGGYLSISDTAEGKSALLFKPNPKSTAFHVDFPAGAGMGIGGELFEIGFVKESASAGWSFTGTTHLGFTGFPGGLGKMLPSKVTAKLVAGKKDVRISALNVSDPIELALPTVQGKSLGKATVQLTELGISIKPQLGLVLEAGLGLPAELNTYLGAQLFRVYQKGNPVSMARTRFTISGTGVAVQFVSSPFAAANTVVINGESWFDVDLGQYGALSLKMPTFLYDGVTQYFEAGGGCKVTRPLALPLAPLKLFLEACGGKAMADIFPDKLPIESLSLVDKNGDLKIDELVTFLKKAGSVPNEVVTALKQTGKVLNRFPDGFKSYLKLEVPERLDFKFGFSPAGRVSLALLAPEKPVRVLFPSVVQSYVPMPGLTGLELRKISVGTLMTGTLFYGEVDALIDQFDVPSLALSLMLPRDQDFPLPTSNQLQRRVILDDVFCIIPVSQGLPVPIPVFYDEIGFEYLGIEGLGLQAHVGFPKPALDGAAAMALFKTFDTFFNDRKALLDPKTPPGGVQLGFVFHDEFLQAPEYLGGGVLGTKGKTVNVGSWKYVAAMMNFGKTFSLNDCISAIPLENRAGSAQYKFAFMKFDADWLLTTPAEFKKGSFERLKLSASDCADFMTVLPSVGSTAGQAQKGNEEGLVTFVRGKADLEFVRMQAAFGLAASGSMGFNTGFKLNGAFGNTELELSGAVMVNAPLASDTAAAPVLQAATPAPTSTSAAPKPPQAIKALSFNGKNSCIELPASDSLVLPEYTIEIWLKSSRVEGREWADVFGKQGSGQRNNFLAINANNAYYHHRFTDNSNYNAGAPNTANGSLQWGRWQHVAITNDGVTAKTYVDGKEAASGPVVGKLALSKQSLFIGKVDSFWKGEIAEIRIWRRALGAGQIESQMRELLDGDEKDLVSLYRFDTDTGERVVDLCGRNHGILRNGSFVESDLLLLRGLAFNGKSDYAEVLDSQSLRLGAYTAEVWFKPVKTAEDMHADAQASMVASQEAMFKAMKAMGVKPPNLPKPEFKWRGVFGKKGRNYALFIRGDGLVHHRFHSAAGSNDGAPDTAAGVIQWNKWNHVAITNDGKVARTFVNGVKLTEGPVTGALVIDNERISIGRNADGSDDAFFNGELGEIRLWSRARSPEEISGNMYRRLDGKDASLVSLWRFSDAQGNTLPDACGRNAGRLSVEKAKPQETGVTQGTSTALVTAPAEPARAAIQIQGHTHLAVAGRKVLVGDLRLVNDQFWFTGQLDLFPKDWPLQVTGHVEGLVSKQRFALSGETRNALFGLVLSESRLFMSNEQLRLEGRWLGAYLKLDVSWDKGDPRFAGSVGFSASPRLDFGTIRIGGVKVADNFRISLDIAADVSVAISRQGLAGNVTAKFKINGKGFELRMGFDVAPADLAQLFNWIKQKIIDAPEKYLAHLFTDAMTWLKNVAEGTIEFARHVGEAVGEVMKSVYKLPAQVTVNMMKGVGYAANQVGAALNKAYNVAEKEAAAMLKGAGYAAEEVGHALQSAYNTSAEAASKVLKDIGYGVNEVGKAMTSAYNKTASECEKLLSSAGFSSKSIKGAINDLGKGASDLGNAIGKGIGSLF